MGAIPWGFSYAKRFRIHFSTNLFDREEVKRCRRNRCDPALIPAAPTSVKDSFVNSTVWRNAASTTNTSAAPMLTASTAEHGNASVTAMRRSIPSVRCVSRKVG